MSLHPDIKNHDRALEQAANDHGAGVEAIVRNIDGELPPESSSRAAFALGEFLRRMVTPNNPKATGIRFATFAHIFSPELMGPSLRAMAGCLGITRAAMSKQAIAIRKEFNLSWRGAKSESSRAAYAAAQHRAVAAGRHSLQVLARRKAAKARRRRRK